MESNRELIRLMTLASRVIAWVVITLALLVLAGWQFDIEVLKRLREGAVAMNPLTAILFICSAITIWLLNSHGASRRRYTAAKVISLLVVSVSFLKLISAVAGFDFRIDQLLFYEKLNAETANGFANRIAPNTAAAFFFTGSALLMAAFKSERYKLIQGLAMICGLLGLFSIVGYLYNTQEFYAVKRFIPMAINTASLFFLLAVSILFLYSDKGIMSDFTTVYSGSLTARRLIPAAILIMVILGLLRILGEYYGLYSREIGTALLVIITIIAFMLLIRQNARILNEHDRMQEAAELNLKKTNERVLKILETSAEARVITSRNSGKIIYINSAAEDLFGIKRISALGKTTTELGLVSLEKRSAVLQELEEHGNIRGMEIIIPAGDKGERDVLINMDPIVLDGESCLLASFIDITLRKKNEEKIATLNKKLESKIDELKKLNTELEDKNKELEAFSYTVSHDLRAPLRAIDGFSSILKTSATELKAENLVLLDNILRSVVKMNKLIDDLLAFSRLGKKDLNKTQINTRELVEMIVHQPNIKQLNAKAEVIVKDLPVLFGDQSLIEQVLTNLISNALKYSRQKDHPVVEIGGTDGVKEKIVYVKDNGAGFDMKYYHKLFGVFQRLHDPEQYEGTGVGLAIVHRIVTKHGGRVWGDAKVDEGATFWFALPEEPS